MKPAPLKDSCFVRVQVLNKDVDLYAKKDVAAAVAWLKAALWKSAGGKPRQTGKTILQILSVNMVKKVEELIDAAFPDVIDGNKQEV